MATGERNDARPFIPERPTLRRLKEAAAACRGCHLWRRASQTVFGEGRKLARVMLVGEQPGDREDRDGRPLVGPAGRELDRGLAAAGIDRCDTYVTNVVRPFKFARRGKRRIHQTPKRFESDLAPLVVATVHPSVILRAPTDADRHAEQRAFAEDLRVVAEAPA